MLTLKRIKEIAAEHGDLYPWYISALIQAAEESQEAFRQQAVQEIHEKFAAAWNGGFNTEIAAWRDRILSVPCLQPPKPAVADWAVRAAKAIQATSVENIPDGYEKQILADAAIIEKCFKDSQK